MEADRTCKTLAAEGRESAITFGSASAGRVHPLASTLVSTSASASASALERPAFLTTCDGFICGAHRQLPPREYMQVEQLLQSLRRDLTGGQDVYVLICAILQRHNATELLSLFERLMSLGRPQEASLLLLRQPCGVHVKEGMATSPAPNLQIRRIPSLCRRPRPGAGRLMQQPVILLLEPSDRPSTDTPEECLVSLVLPGLQ